MIFFFFSSRRRHTRLQGDWSSDVCSSDLRRPRRLPAPHRGTRQGPRQRPAQGGGGSRPYTRLFSPGDARFPSLTLCRHDRSEEHTSELQSPCNLVCRLLLEKKNTRINNYAVLDHEIVFHAPSRWSSATRSTPTLTLSRLRGCARALPFLQPSPSTGRGCRSV